MTETQDRHRELEEALGYRFADASLLERALTHRSHSHEQGVISSNYERLEFLGDALLGFLVAHWLYRDDPGAAEGQLSRRRQSLVRTSSLAEAARRVGLGSAIRLGRGEESSGGRDKLSLLADTFEAVLGAVYLDGGIRAARSFVQRHLRRELRASRQASEHSDDYKTRLQEAIQARLQRTPRYRIVSTTGPAHALEFEVEVLLEDRILGSGRGSNRKLAEQAAARQALERFHRRSEDPS
jgi:ribonuclease-3